MGWDALIVVEMLLWDSLSRFCVSRVAGAALPGRTTLVEFYFPEEEDPPLFSSLFSFSFLSFSLSSFHSFSSDVFSFAPPFVQRGSIEEEREEEEEEEEREEEG